MTSRRARLEALLAEDPHDPFLQYALALECRKEQQFEACLSGLQKLMTGASPYIPAFFMAGQVLAEQGQVERARAALRDGIEHARHAGDAHAAGEMSELLASLGPQ